MIITLCNQKGGSGKTTLTLLLALALDSIGRKVAVIDHDPQGTSSQAIKYLREEDLTKIELSSSANGFDATFIDTAPKLDDVLAKAIRASDRVVVVSSPSPADLWSTQRSRNFVMENLKPGVKTGLLFNSVVKAARISRSVEELEVLAKQVGLPALKNFVTRRQAYQYAVLQGWRILRAAEQHEIMSMALEVTTM
jgi:chromosome partitioning protein